MGKVLIFNRGVEELQPALVDLFADWTAKLRGVIVDTLPPGLRSRMVPQMLGGEEPWLFIEKIEIHQDDGGVCIGAMIYFGEKPGGLNLPAAVEKIEPV